MTREADPPPLGPRPMFATDAEAQAWASEWFAGRTPRAHDPKLYLQPDGLWDQLLPGEDGSPPAVALMRLSWLQKRARQLRRAPNEAARRALALPRRQELERDHPEALLSVDEVRALERGRNPGDEKKRPLRVLSISHAWATPQHPDPLGATLVAFAERVRVLRRRPRVRDRQHTQQRTFLIFVVGVALERPHLVDAEQRLGVVALELLPPR